MNIREDGKGVELFVFFLGVHELARNLLFFCPMCAPTRVHGPPGNTNAPLHRHARPHDTLPNTRPAARRATRMRTQEKLKFGQNTEFTSMVHSLMVNSNHPARASFYVAQSGLHPNSARVDASLNSAEPMPVQQDHGHTGSTASFLDRVRWQHGVLVHAPHRDTRTLMDGPTPKHQLAYPSVCVLSGTISLAANVFLAVVSSAHVCGVSNCGRTLSTFSTVPTKTSIHVRISLHAHPQRTLTSQVLHIIGN